MRSIARYLLAWIMGALILGSLVVMVFAYLDTLEEMGEGFDANLQSIAEAVASSREPALSASLRASPLTASTGVAGATTSDEERLVLQAWDRTGRPVFMSDPQVAIPFAWSTGWSKHRIDGQDWIVYSVRTDSGVAQAAQRLAVRQAMAAEATAKVIWPLVGMTGVVAGLLLYGLRRGLKPLEATAQEIARRSDGSLEPIGVQGVPREFHSIVHSTNGLMHRLGAALGGQRRFIADAAHELRTPVAALRLQLELLRQADESTRRQALEELAGGIARAERLTQQLLAVARIEPDGAELHVTRINLADLVRTTVTSFSIQAEQAGLDLGADAPGEVLVKGDLDQLSILLNNLVENALRYTPAGGVVDVIARQVGEGALLIVRDDGPGIPEHERVRVFERFYRCADAPAPRDASGSGLGLAIVWGIVQRHGASIQLTSGPGNRGLQVQIALGMAPDAAAPTL